MNSKALATGAKDIGKDATGEKITGTEVTRTKKEDVDGNSGEENVPKDENKDDDPKGQTDKSLKMKAGTGKRSGSKAYDDTPLPEEDEEDSVEEDDDAEDQRPGEKARSSKNEEEIKKRAEADEDARYQQRLETKTKSLEETKKTML